VKMGNGLLYDLTRDIDNVVEGMSPEVEKQVRLKVIAERIKNHNDRNGNNNQHTNNNGGIDRFVNGNTNGRCSVQKQPAQSYTPASNGNHYHKLPMPKQVLELTLPLTPESLNGCYINQHVKFETTFGDKMCPVEGIVADKYKNGITLTKIMVKGPETYMMNGPLNLHLPETAAPAQAYA